MVVSKINFTVCSAVKIFIHTFADASPAKRKNNFIMKTVFSREYLSPDIQQFDIKIESGFAGSTASLENPNVESEIDW